MNLDHAVDIYFYQNSRDILFLRRRDEKYFILKGEYESNDIGHAAMSAIDSDLFKDYEWINIDESFSIDWDVVLCASAWRDSGSLIVSSPVYVKDIEKHPKILLSKNPKFSELGEAVMGRFKYCREMEENLE